MRLSWNTQKSLRWKNNFSSDFYVCFLLFVCFFFGSAQFIFSGFDFQERALNLIRRLKQRAAAFPAPVGRFKITVFAPERGYFYHSNPNYFIYAWRDKRKINKRPWFICRFTHFEFSWRLPEYRSHRSRQNHGHKAVQPYQNFYWFILHGWSW